MIDITTGEMKLNGVVIRPDMGIEDFKRYPANQVTVRDRGNGRGIITLTQLVVSNGISARVKVWINGLTGSFRVTVLPDLTGQNGMDLLGASKAWIFGMIPESYFSKSTDSCLTAAFSWGSIVAQYLPDREYGVKGGDLQIEYRKTGRV